MAETIPVSAIIVIILAFLSVVVVITGVVGLANTNKTLTPSSTTYSHAINPADTCSPTQSESWGIVGIATDSFNYGFGTVSFVIGEYSSDFTGLFVTSISFSLCGYKNDTIADSNPINIGIYSQTNGNPIQILGSVPFDSLATCKLNQDGSGGTCGAQHPTTITVTGSYNIQDSHSPGGIDFIGMAFPSHSAVGHDVLSFCTNACSATVIPHGGICDLFAASNKICHTGASNTDTLGVALGGTFLFSASNVDPNITTLTVTEFSAVGIIGVLEFLYIMAKYGKHQGE